MRLPRDLTGDELARALRALLMKDKGGHVIGFERLNYPDAEAEPVRLSFETVGMAALPLSA